MKKSVLLASAVVGTLFISPGVALAELPLGERTVYLKAESGERRAVASLTFEQAGPDEVSYSLSVVDDAFGDYFLSMRPFQCLESSEKHWCYVPYPYENNRKISADDLTDLEYDLLFIWKGATEYGINMWNGVYYDLELADGGLNGVLSEINMDVLSVPPEAGNLRPIRSADIHSADPDSHWLPYVVIE
ncbi:hypothetical protein [Actibacterium atlanticum]|uniref:hypothetical protein n=1 Tax=Actibacterium atlanticum TaxID=1461693 RepID=UPI0012DD886D|nr:hypothetical protein [Actibacterium atlanticum]